MPSHDAPGFREDPHTATYVCTHVWTEGAPILYVAHEADGAWQFLCGALHSEPSECLVIGLSHVVERDPSLEALAGMCTGHVAERGQPASAWNVQDETLDNVREVIREHGWWVGLFEEEDDTPSVAYTIGLYETFGHPELIMFGLPTTSMHEILNVCGGLIRDGARFADGASSDEVLEKHPVRFRAVIAPDSHATFLGYGLRFYEGRELSVLQCVWPDEAGKFPGEPGAESYLASEQPLLP